MSQTRAILETPISRVAISERVVQRVLDLVREGELKPGQKLPSERSLALRMEVGRPSLREALRALSLLGVVDIKQGEGVFVSALNPEVLLAPLHFFLTLDPQNLDDLFEARIVIESGIAGLAAQFLDKSKIDQLVKCIEDGKMHLEDTEKFLELDIEFHKIITDTAGNHFLKRIAQSFHELTRASRNLTAKLPGIREQSHADHERIFHALLHRDSNKASEAMRQHLLNVRDGYHRTLSKAVGHDNEFGSEV